MADVIARRQQVLVSTLTTLYSEVERNRLRTVALNNVKAWQEKVTQNEGGLIIRVEADDWGVATHRATKEFGKVFASLNMANQTVFGGGYVSGMVAQEENMFRRTDCHFSHPANYKDSKEKSVEDVVLRMISYSPEEEKLVESLSGRCYLDDTPRICIRGPEDRTAEDLGYEILPEDEIFPFYELRSAATDLRDPSLRALPLGQQKQLMRKKIRAQLNTLIEHGRRHTILSAFGCGAFLNNATMVATLYKEEIEKSRDSFDVVIFGIFHAGYGEDNYTPFKNVFVD